MLVVQLLFVTCGIGVNYPQSHLLWSSRSKTSFQNHKNRIEKALFMEFRK